MTFTRKNVWELGGDWADPILWYARGVNALKVRAVFEITHLIDTHLAGTLNVAQLHAQLVPVNPEEAQISIGRISVFRQGN
jgi:hypothetical protein